MSQMPVFSKDGRFMGSVNSDVVDATCGHPADQVERDQDGDCHSGCCDGYRCTACGRRFRIEVPD